jgi:hypothetical protein
MARATLASTQRELAFPGDLKLGDDGPGVKRLQEWLTFHGASPGTIDSGYGDDTQKALAKFQAAQGMATIGTFDDATWKLLTAPLYKADAFASTATSAHDAVVQTAQAHLDQRATEIGGQNRGPWVRYYTHGGEGDEWEWCQGFASSMFQIAFDTLDRPAPFPTTIVEHQVGIWCLYVPTFVDSAVKAKGGFLSGSAADVADRIHPGAFFFVRGGPVRYEHVGLVESVDKAAGMFTTVEGNWGNKVSRGKRMIGPDFDFGVFPA